MERKPYPFFCSVEFLTVLVKVGTVSTPFLIAIATTGFTLANALALVFSGILTGCLLAAQELEIHQNLWSNAPLIRNKSDAITNIVVNAAKEKAQESRGTVQEILDTFEVHELVDFAVKPSIGGAVNQLLKRIKF